METSAATAAAAQCKRSLTRRTSSSSSSSFRLRCPSLNSLRLRRIFDLFDKNNDSMITVEELCQALNLLGLDADPSELDLMVRSYIKQGNIGLKFEDFEALHRSLNDTFFNNGEVQLVEKEEESDLTEAFKVFDEDGDGYISARELQVVLGKLGFPEGREMDRVEKMISSVDRNHDGRVDFFEFKDMMRSVVMLRSA
uniref:Putative calcium-binding allergen Bet v 3-like n=1 Tax=Davidia involucrata TaxID=16924 RepID=A0A5B7ATE9_DAVIN